MHKICLFCGGKKQHKSNRLETKLSVKMKVEPRNRQPEYHDHVKFLTIFDGFVAILPIIGDVVERNLLKRRAMTLSR
jgi:hypothetical protein